MNSLVLLTLAVLACAAAAPAAREGGNLHAGLAKSKRSEDNTIPFQRRFKEEFYSDPAEQIIQDIISRDINHNEGRHQTPGRVARAGRPINLGHKSIRSSPNYVDINDIDV